MTIQRHTTRPQESVVSLIIVHADIDTELDY